MRQYYKALGVPAPRIVTAPLESLLGANSTPAVRALLPRLMEATDGVTALSSPGDMRKPWDLVIRHLGPSFAYSLPVHSFHTRRDRVASLKTCRLHGAAIQRASPLGPGRALTLPCGWNNAGRKRAALAPIPWISTATPWGLCAHGLRGAGPRCWFAGACGGLRGRSGRAQGGVQGAGTTAPQLADGGRNPAA